jgi:hypothetical protein
MERLVNKLIADKAVVEVPQSSHHHVSPIIAITDRDSESLVINVTYLNQLTPPKFRLPARDAPRHWIKRDDLLGKVDFKSAYHQLKLHPRMKRFFVFKFQDKYYQYEVLPQGWNMSPWIWTRYANRLQHLMAEQGIRCCLYMDDALLANKAPIFHTVIQKVLNTW